MFVMSFDLLSMFSQVYEFVLGRKPIDIMNQITIDI